MKKLEVGFKRLAYVNDDNNSDIHKHNKGNLLFVV